MYKLTCLFIFCWSCLLAQDAIKVEKAVAFQEALNTKFASAVTSPLVAEDLAQFKGLSFFAIDTMYSVQAKFVRTPYETPFIMKTTTHREPLYVKYGEAHFKLHDKEWVLNIYQHQELKLDAAYDAYLFLPFTDLSNGRTTYEGGRFIDLSIPVGDTIHIDFNTAYNPYCAYSSRYSCPIPPEENHLTLEIPVGVRSFVSSVRTD